MQPYIQSTDNEVFENEHVSDCDYEDDVKEDSIMNDRYRTGFISDCIAMPDGFRRLTTFPRKRRSMLAISPHVKIEFRTVRDVIWNRCDRCVQLCGELEAMRSN